MGAEEIAPRMVELGVVAVDVGEEDPGARHVPQRQALRLQARLGAPEQRVGLAGIRARLRTPPIAGDVRACRCSRAGSRWRGGSRRVAARRALGR
jgi:hypothetical protein